MAHLSEELRHTVSAEWYARYAADRQGGSGAGNQTRLRYYEALSKILAGLEPDFGWRHAIIDRRDLAAVAGAKASSTLYSLFGSSSRALISRYTGSPLASGVGPGPVEALIAEAKVDSFWPYRQAWLGALRRVGREEPRFAAETLIRVLAEWAVVQRPLAAVRHCAAPLCAVEDLWLICPAEPPVAAVATLLTKVIESAHSPRRLSALGVLNGVHDEVMLLGFGHTAPLDELMGELSEGLAAIEHLVPRLSRADRDTVAVELTPQLAAVLELLRRKP